MQNEFEKKIQDQLREFALTPGDAVWDKVALRIAGEKKRRRAAYLWWTAAAFMLIAGGAAFWWFTGKDINTTHSAVVEQSAPANRRDTTGASIITKQNTSATSVSNKKDNATTASPEINQHDIATNRQNQSSQVVATVTSKQSQKVRLRKEIVPVQPTPRSAAALSSTTQQVRDKDEKAGQPYAATTPAQKGNVEDQSIHTVTAGKPSATESGIQEPVLSSTGVDPLSTDKSTVATPILPDAPKATNIDSGLSNQTEIKLPTKQVVSAKRKLAVGVQVYAGLSDNKTGFPILSEKSLADFQNTSPQNNTGTISSGSRVDDVSPLTYHSSLSYGIGAFAEKRMGKRWSLSAGVDYHYYSANTYAGTKVFGQRSLFDSVFNRSVFVNEFYSGASLSSSFGQPGNFKNTYQLLQLPLLLNYQLNRQSKKPAYLSAGITPGIVLRTRALYYDRFNRVSYVDRKQFRSYQLSVEAGLQQTIITNNRLQVRLGPQVRYGLTNIAQPLTNPSQHLFFFGLKSSFLFTSGR